MSFWNRPSEGSDKPTLEAEAMQMLVAYKDGVYALPLSYAATATDCEEGRAILAASPDLRLAIVKLLDGYRQLPAFKDWYFPTPIESLRQALFKSELPWKVHELELLVRRVQGKRSYHWTGVLLQVERYISGGNPLTLAMSDALNALIGTLATEHTSDARKLRGRIEALLGLMRSVKPDAGEAWADVALEDLQSFSEDTRAAWTGLLCHASDSEPALPSAAWRKHGRSLVEAIGLCSFRYYVTKWFSAITTPSLGYIVYIHSDSESRQPNSDGSERNISLLKGLAWMCADSSESEVARALAKMVDATLKKIPGIGPWGTRAANAAIYALTEMPCPEAVAQLGRLKTRVTFGTVLKQIENGLEVAAKRAGVTKSDLEDLAVPTFGFDANGVRREEFGECAAVATIGPTGDVTVEWFAAGGKAVKSVPAAAKSSHAAELKQFKSDVEAAGKMLSAQKLRFDTFYLPERVWSLATWRERFAEHPVLGNVAKRLIWHVTEGERRGHGIWDMDRSGFVDFDGESLTWPTDAAEIRLWHPIGFSVEAVVRWRAFLQDRGIVQPFKQAHREIYVVTEAELTTETYSNRFAGHILKQHQMNQLAGLRGWKNKLRLMVDDFYPPASKEIPSLGLRAEFWIEGAGDDYGIDTTDAGTYLYLSTDQVRFYRSDAEQNTAHAGGGGYTAGDWRANTPVPALPLVDVPALVLSEVMRDIDLFVGVSSVANDPTWQDGGPRNEYRTYWNDFSFGDLGPTAQTRREVLERLLPRLKIASRATLMDKFLVVRGDLRTYKIHLGSGNILMEPNDQYLCIVESRGGKSDIPVNFLPFEGDQRLALILSKAFLLADDKQITDRSILTQIDANR